MALCAIAGIIQNAVIGHLNTKVLYQDKIMKVKELGHCLTAACVGAQGLL